MTDQQIALVFPGQGSQRPGMAQPWRDSPAFERWHEAGDVLGRDVARLGLHAGEDELREPATCQVALFVHAAVVLEAWHAAGGGTPAAVAGHSLGEYDALLAAGVLPFPDALRLVDARARHTQEAADAAPGTMVACLGYDVEDVRAACAGVGAHVANDNAPGQIVAAGPAEALERLREALARVEAPRGKVVAVKVGAAYHSPHMRQAVEPFGNALDGACFADARVPVVANVDARPHTEATAWPDLLRTQLVSPVRWRETVGTLAELGVTQVVELCAAPVLTALVKRTDPGLGRRSVTTPQEL
jgi:[acyl-carrier-protein] S-malonyltransferase